MNPVTNFITGSKLGVCNGVNILAKPINFFKEVKGELNKVSWSTRKELLASTILVITVTGILTVFIGIVDLGLSRFLSVIFK
ncbi:MAG: preprotein translocase subunit SecE [Candidatus Omnitrophica bacterium]|nr:preprotein translocase subunit SecE [Candidatus Omnitrophota bacterium]